MSGESSISSRSRRESALRAIGMTVGERWTLLSVIGTGGTATIYEGVHRNGSRVAVKVLHADLSAHARIRRRFLAEGYAANLVRHDGAVKVLDDGETAAGGAYLVMELLEGETLAARLLRDGPAPPERVLAWSVDVLEILASAHEHHVVHRDVKPSNILLTHRGQVKLLDFGIARISVESSGDALLTEPGVALGTPAFMAPEQATGSLAEIGPATDIWGVGATMFQLLTGRPVQERPRADSASETNLTAPPVRAFAPNLSPELAKVVDCALSLRPSDRWPTARAMILALERVRERAPEPIVIGPETLDEDPAIAFEPASTRRQSGRSARLGIVVMLAGGSFWLWTTRSASPSHPAAITSGAARGVPAAAVSAASPKLETAAVDPARPPSTPENGSSLGAPRSPPRKPSETTLAPAPARRSAVPNDAADSLDAMLDRRK